jgi:hypothetical protein
MTKEQIFLLVASAGLLPIALSYGAAPKASLSFLYNINVSDVNLAHIFRAVMGLYLALIIFWLCGSKNKKLELPALWSLVVFMLGLAAGRALSLIIDGIAHPLLVIFLVLEIVFGTIGLVLIKNNKVY